VIAVRTALTMTTSSDELMSSLARPREGIAEVMDCSVDDIVDDVFAMCAVEI